MNRTGHRRTTIKTTVAGALRDHGFSDVTVLGGASGIGAAAVRPAEA
ncbi:hypothetical protein [Nonomuraea sp. NPDC049480]